MSAQKQSAQKPSVERPANEDLKAKMREALDRKQSHDHPDDSAARQGKAHGPEIAGGAGVKMHRRKAGGGGA